MAQIIFNKQYNKMYAQKRLAIAIGSKMEENAPLKEAHIIEGEISEEIEHEILEPEEVRK